VPDHGRTEPRKIQHLRRGELRHADRNSGRHARRWSASAEETTRLKEVL
jgi:hypothetical protein